MIDYLQFSRNPNNTLCMFYHVILTTTLNYLLFYRLGHLDYSYLILKPMLFAVTM